MRWSIKDFHPLSLRQGPRAKVGFVNSRRAYGKTCSEFWRRRVRNVVGSGVEEVFLAPGRADPTFSWRRGGRKVEDDGPTGRWRGRWPACRAGATASRTGFRRTKGRRWARAEAPQVHQLADGLLPRVIKVHDVHNTSSIRKRSWTARRTRGSRRLSARGRRRRA